MPKAARQTARDRYDSAAVVTAVATLLNNIRPNSSGINIHNYSITAPANTTTLLALLWRPGPRAGAETERKRKRFTKELHHASRGGDHEHSESLSAYAA